MNTNMLIGGVITVVLLVTMSYVFVSPIAKKWMNNEATSESVIQKSTMAITPQTSDDYSDAYDDDDGKEDREEREDVDDDDPISSAPTAISPTTSESKRATSQSSVAPSIYTLALVAQHAGKTSCWSAINGKVYDLTSFIGKHPGGERRILNICGKDGSNAFSGQHEGEPTPEQILASYYLGELAR